MPSNSAKVSMHHNPVMHTYGISAVEFTSQIFLLAQVVVAVHLFLWAMYIVMKHLIHAFSCASSSVKSTQEAGDAIICALNKLLVLAFQVSPAHNLIIYEQVWSMNEVFISLVPSTVLRPGSFVSTMFLSILLHTIYFVEFFVSATSWYGLRLAARERGPIAITILFLSDSPTRVSSGSNRVPVVPLAYSGKPVILWIMWNLKCTEINQRESNFSVRVHSC